MADFAAFPPADPDASMSIELWDKGFHRLGWIGTPLQASFTPRVNAVGDGSFTVLADHPRIADLMTPGCRALATYRPGTGSPFRLLSGRVKTRAGDIGGQPTRTCTVVDDWNLLHTTLGWPDPTLPVDQQSAVAADKLSGPAETVALDLIRRNLVQRLGRPVVIPDSQGRGAQISVQTRMEYLADVLFPAVDEAGIILDIGQVGDHLEVTVREPGTWPFPLTEQSGPITGGNFADSDPEATRVIVGAGSGAGTDSETGATARIFREFVDADAEASIGEPLEVYLDGSVDLTGDVTARTTQLAADAFAENAAKVSLDLELVEAGGLRYGAYREGDVMTVSLAGAPLYADRISEVRVDLQPGTGLTATPKIGARAEDADSVLIGNVRHLGRALRSLQRR